MRAAPERGKPSSSACAAGSSLSWPMRTRFSSCFNGIFASGEHDVFSFEHPGQERLVGSTAMVILLARIQRGADTATELSLGNLERHEDVIKCKVIRDQKDVDVAGCGIQALGDRAKQQR